MCGAYHRSIIPPPSACPKLVPPIVVHLLVMYEVIVTGRHRQWSMWVPAAAAVAAAAAAATRCCCGAHGCPAAAAEVAETAGCCSCTVQQGRYSGLGVLAILVGVLATLVHCYMACLGQQDVGGIVAGGDGSLSMWWPPSAVEQQQAQVGGLWPHGAPLRMRRERGAGGLATLHLRSRVSCSWSQVQDAGNPKP